MHKLIIGAVTVAALLGAPAAAGAATAAPPKWTPVIDPLYSGQHNGSITLPATKVCAFGVKVAVVTNGELRNVMTLPDGTMVIASTLSMTDVTICFINIDTPLTLNSSRPYTRT